MGRKYFKKKMQIDENNIYTFLDKLNYFCSIFADKFIKTTVNAGKCDNIN